MGWSISLGNRATLRQCELEGLDPGPRSVITPELEIKLKEAARTVPIMIGAATQCVTRYPNNSYVLTALHKYFSLSPQDALRASITQRIGEIYRMTLAGLMGEYSLYVFAPDAAKERTNAFVPGTPPKGSAALGAFFSSKDHMPWAAFQAAAYKDSKVAREKREIHLSLTYIASPDAASADIARTIIHEGTHKWANTTDVCYKHSTVSKCFTKDDIDTIKPVTGSGFTRYTEDMDEKAEKLRIQFTKFNKVTMQAVRVPAYESSAFKTEADSWVKNADSYAWAARRLWKKYELIIAESMPH